MTKPIIEGEVFMSILLLGSWFFLWTFYIVFKMKIRFYITTVSKTWVINTHQSLDLTCLSMFIILRKLFGMFLVLKKFYLPSHGAYSYEASLALLYWKDSEEICVRNTFHQNSILIICFLLIQPGHNSEYVQSDSNFGRTIIFLFSSDRAVWHRKAHISFKLSFYATETLYNIEFVRQ